VNQARIFGEAKIHVSGYAENDLGLARARRAPAGRRL